jgi:hypothetical protein
MPRSLVLACVFLLSLGAVQARAQTDPCAPGAPSSAVATTGQALLMQVCAPKVDQNGGPVTPITGWALYTNGARSLPVFVAGATTASGFTLWSLATFAPASTGAFTYQIAAIDSKAREGLKSDPFVLTVSLPDAAPAKPPVFIVKPQ